MSLERSEDIDRLLHDAEHADSGARMAGVMRDTEAALRLTRKRDDLIAHAHSLDPHHVEDAWRDTSLPIPARRSSSERGSENG